MAFTEYEKEAAHWETQGHRAGLPFCTLLKVKGRPYPYGSIVQTGAPMFPTYECKAFFCDANGRERLIWMGETNNLAEAKTAVMSWHESRFEVAA